MPSVARRALVMIGALALSGSVATIAASGIAAATGEASDRASHSIAITDSAFGTAVLAEVPGSVKVNENVAPSSTLPVHVGDTVTWTSADDRPHTVTSQDGAFDSYAYLCEYHPDMTGTIVVEAAAAQAPANPPPAASPAPAGGTASAPSQHAGRDAPDQPDTAVAPPAGQIPVISYLLWGAGLLLLGIRFLPTWAGTAVPPMRPPGGWRR